MDIQWVILAQGHKIYANKTIDIYGICHHFNRIFGLAKAPIQLIAKINFSPNEAGTQKLMGLTIAHMDRGMVAEDEELYTLPNLKSWGTETTYIVIPLGSIELVHKGEYVFTLSIDGEPKNEERLIVR